ncbi:MAG: gamma-glutamyltranspeptidase [Candidatus Binatia bacterium]|nr:MAG: gamma-glutamyltranspeptidase [Candidatus Binatia bacterium]
MPEYRRGRLPLPPVRVPLQARGLVAQGIGGRPRQAMRRFTEFLLLVACILAARSSVEARAELAARGMVAAEHPLAARAGAAILRQGGNAVDAAVATAFAVCVVNPSSCGIGGGGFFVYYRASDHKAFALDFRETAPAALRPEAFFSSGQADPRRSQRGGLAVGVPGEVAGLALAQQRFGTLPLKTVLQPAIQLARDGFPIGAHLAQEIAKHQDEIASQPALRRWFFRADGTPRKEGDLLQLPELAQTLAAIAQHGPDAFYRGAIAREIVRAVREAGGVMSLEDLANYRPKWRDPIAGDYRDFRILTMPPPSSGGGVILAALGILRSDDLPSMGQNSSGYLHLLAETMKHVFADRARYYGDPDFVTVPVARLLDPDLTASLRRRILATRTLPPEQYGSHLEPSASPREDQGTAHLSVMDASGNAVACTTTINTAFGAMLVAGSTGVLLNNQMDDFALAPGTANAYGLIGGAANAVAPGKRPLSSMSPTIVLQGNRAVASLGGSGGPMIISGTLQVLLNLLAFGYDAERSVAAPRIHHQWEPAVLLVEPQIDPEVRRVLQQIGHVVKEVPMMGAIQIVRRTSSGFEGAADPRKGGAASGW